VNSFREVSFGDWAIEKRAEGILDRCGVADIPQVMNCNVAAVNKVSIPVVCVKIGKGM